MNNCERYEDLCSAALDNALTAQEKEELDAHLAVCPSCRAYLEDLQQMRALWKELEVPVPKELHEKMMGAIEAEVQKTIVQIPQKQRRRPPVFTMLAAAAACVMLAVSGQLTGLFGQMSSVPLQTASHKDDVPSTADTTVPQSKLQDTTVQPAPKPEQQEVKKPEPEPKSELEPQSEIVEQRVIQDEAKEPRKPKEPKEKQPEQPVVDPKPEVTEEIPSENVPQPANEGIMTADVEAQDTPGNMVRGVEPPAAVTYAITGGLPDELCQMQFARCYDVTGGTELPVLDDMTLLVTADGISYYSVENNESKIGQVQQELKKSGYTLTLNETSGVSIQRSAKTILLIVYTA